MPFVHGHPRESGWVVSHSRRPQRAGDDQLDLALPGPRPGEDQVDEADRDDDGSDDRPDDPDEDASVRSIPRRTASTR
jgi:hypothetical protein